MSGDKQVGHCGWNGVEQRGLRSETRAGSRKQDLQDFLAVMRTGFAPSEMGSHEVLSERATCSDF